MKRFLLALTLALMLPACAVLFSFDNVKKYRVTGQPGIFLVAPGPGLMDLASSDPLKILAVAGSCTPTPILEGEGFAYRCDVSKALAAPYLCRIPEHVKVGEACILNYAVQAESISQITVYWEGVVK